MYVCMYVLYVCMHALFYKQVHKEWCSVTLSDKTAERWPPFCPTLFDSQAVQSTPSSYIQWHAKLGWHKLLLLLELELCFAMLFI